MDEPQTKRFIQTLSKKLYQDLEKVAAYRGEISVQTLIRIVIVPDWLKDYKDSDSQKTAKNRKAGKSKNYSFR